MDFKNHYYTTTNDILTRHRNILNEYDELNNENELKNFIVYCEHMLYSERADEILKGHQIKPYYSKLYRIINNIYEEENPEEK